MLLYGRTANRVLAWLYTFSVVNPKWFITSLTGADAPNRSWPTDEPSRPTYFCQPSVTPASTERRLRTDGGKTRSRYSCGWRSKIAVEGMLTMRTFTPSDFSFSPASTHHCNS